MIYLIDLKAQAYRAHHGFSKAPLLDSRGEHVSALYGVTSALLTIRCMSDLTAWACAWDLPAPTFRHAIYPEYKANRSPMPDDLARQLPLVRQMCTALRVPIIAERGYEADDVMASLTRMAFPEPVAIVSPDKDLYCLLDDRVSALVLRGASETPVWTRPEDIHAKWGIEPVQVPDMLALMGDSADGIPGVAGIGEKNAARLIAAYGDLAGVYASLDSESRRIALLLTAGRASAYQARELVQLCTDLRFPPLVLDEPDWSAVQELADAHGLGERVRWLLAKEAA